MVNPLIDPPILYVDPPLDELEELLLDDPEPDELPDELDELLLEEDEDETPDEDDEETPELDDELVEPPDEEELEPLLEELSLLDADEEDPADGDAFCTELTLPQAEIAIANAAARQYRRVSRTSRPHYENFFINLLRCAKRMRNNRVSRLGYFDFRRRTNPLLYRDKVKSHWAMMDPGASLLFAAKLIPNPNGKILDPSESASYSSL